jgi:acetyl-CoA carboxylase carboxyltransferase component
LTEEESVMSRFDDLEKEYRERTAKALAMGSPKALARRKEQGILNARERIDYLLDEGSFLESGRFAVASRPEIQDRTPADGKVAGFGRMDGRPVALVSNDFTVMGAGSSRINGRKMKHVKGVARSRGLPCIFLGESTGARMPDVMGAGNIGAGDDPTQYMRMRETPWVSGVLGHCYGSSAWYASMADFVVMRKGATMAVSSALLASLAISEEVDPEELGGWRMHTEVSGLVDLAVDSDEEGLDAIKTFLSYLPSHHNEAPPVRPVPAGSDAAIDDIFKYFPENRNRAYDVRRVIRCIIDKNSMFEMKPRFAKAVVTCLARLDGKSVGIVANNPMHKGGAIDPDACDKVTSFLVLCDSFNVPVVLLVDQPGFMIGIEGERKGATGKVMSWMNALSLVTMPKVSVVMGKTYGQAVLNMGGASNAHENVAWTTAEISFMAPEYAVKVVYGLDKEKEPEKFAEKLAEMNQSTSPYAAAANFSTQGVIDPRETRDYLIRTLEFHQLRLDNGIGEHLMRTWPTSY